MPACGTEHYLRQNSGNTTDAHQNCLRNRQTDNRRTETLSRPRSHHRRGFAFQAVEHFQEFKLAERVVLVGVVRLRCCEVRKLRRDLHEVALPVGWSHHGRQSTIIAPEFRRCDRRGRLRVADQDGDSLPLDFLDGFHRRHAAPPVITPTRMKLDGSGIAVTSSCAKKASVLPLCVP